jgi:hypothetical protein
MTNELPKGLYKGEDGVERFWDGTQWLEPQNVEPKKAFPTKKAVSLLIVLALAVGGVFGAVAFVEQKREADAAEEQLKLELAVQAKFEERASEIKSFFRSAVEGCNGGSGVDFDESNLTIDGKGKEDFSGADYVDVVCLVLATGISPAAKSRFDSTNALQGLIEDSWAVLDGDAEVSASWSYHPDSGPSVAMKLDSVFLEDFDFEVHQGLIEFDETTESD